MSLVTIQRSTLRAAPKRLDVARQMVSAEFLKVRKRRGLTAWVSILTVGIVVGAAGVLAILHAANAVRYGPAGGLSNLANAAYALSALGAVAAVLVGATIGAGDLQAGVFRDLVATGRSRLALFAARIPGGLGLLWPLAAASWAIASAGSVLLAGSNTKPSLSMMAEGGAWVLMSTTVVYLLALGLASLAGSRSAPVGALLAWQFLVSPLAVSVLAWVWRRSWKCSPRYSGHRWSRLALRSARFQTLVKLLLASMPPWPREPPGVVKTRSTVPPPTSSRWAQSTSTVSWSSAMLRIPTSVLGPFSIPRPDRRGSLTARAIRSRPGRRPRRRATARPTADHPTARQ